MSYFTASLSPTFGSYGFHHDNLAKWHSGEDCEETPPSSSTEQNIPQFYSEPLPQGDPSVSELEERFGSSPFFYNSDTAVPISLRFSDTHESLSQEEASIFQDKPFETASSQHDSYSTPQLRLQRFQNSFNRQESAYEDVKAREEQLKSINNYLEYNQLYDDEIHKYAHLIELSLAIFPRSSDGECTLIHRRKTSLPFSMFINEKGIAILLKRHDTGWKRAGGQKIIKRAIFIPIDRTKPIEIAVEAITAKPTEKEQFKRLTSTAGIITPLMLGRYNNKDRIILPKYDGDLSILKKNSLSLDDKISITRQILTGLQTLHSQGLIHRDIKQGNILIRFDHISKTYEAVITDLGHMRSVEELKKLRDNEIKEKKTISQKLYGTRSMSAPDLLCRGYKYPEKADMWALGKTLFSLWGKASIFTKYVTVIDEYSQYIRDGNREIKKLIKELGKQIEKLSRSRAKKERNQLFKILAQTLKLKASKRPAAEEALGTLLNCNSSTQSIVNSGE